VKIIEHTKNEVFWQLKVSLLAYQILMFKYILEKDTKKLAPLLEAALCPYLLCLPGLCDMLLDLIRQKIHDKAQM
jgi:hypothetical protein